MGTPSPKLAITVDRDVHGQGLAAAAAQGKSISAWMTDAARRALRRQDGLAAVDEWEAQNGRWTAEEMDEARRRVQPTGRRPRSSDAKSRMSEVVYDAAVLIAADRNDRRVWPITEHVSRARSFVGTPPLWSRK